MIKGPIRRSFERKAHGQDIFIADCFAKRRIIERSAVAVIGYFQALSGREFVDSSQWGKPLSFKHYEASETMTRVMECDEHSSNTTTEIDGNECTVSYDNMGQLT